MATATETPRATRLKLDAPLVYRSTSEESWAAGSTVDISRSGLLFVPADQSAPDPNLNIVVLLSGTTLESAGVRITTPDLFCGGPVVRTTEAPDGRRAWAVRFDYQSNGDGSSLIWELEAEQRINQH